VKYIFDFFENDASAYVFWFLPLNATLSEEKAQKHTFTVRILLLGTSHFNILNTHIFT